MKIGTDFVYATSTIIGQTIKISEIFAERGLARFDEFYDKKGAYMTAKVYVSQLDIATRIMREITDTHPEYCATPRQYNAIYQAARMVSSALLLPETRSIPGEGLEAWLKTDDIGASSRFMASVLSDSCNISVVQAHPSDPSGLMRCRKLCEAVPELAVRLPIMADISLAWGALIERWDDLCKLMDEEAPDWRASESACPKTFALMKKLGV